MFYPRLRPLNHDGLSVLLHAHSRVTRFFPNQHHRRATLSYVSGSGLLTQDLQDESENYERGRTREKRKKEEKEGEKRGERRRKKRRKRGKKVLFCCFRTNISSLVIITFILFRICWVLDHKRILPRGLPFISSTFKHPHSFFSLSSSFSPSSSERLLRTSVFPPSFIVPLTPLIHRHHSPFSLPLSLSLLLY